jgi:nitronate monooxygenase
MSQNLPAEWIARLALPVIAAPMFLVSGPDLVLACCRAGVIGAFPAPNARTIDDLDAWLKRVTEGLAAAPGAAPYALNMIVHSTYPRLGAELELVQRYRPPLVITALGSPRHVVETVHAYGGRVFADVANVKFARKAAEAGVDGLILVAAGAGGHVGPLAAFAFLPEVRAFWKGAIVLAGAISDGRAVRAAEILGADLAYVGTRFIAAQESLASCDYKAMLIRTGAEDIVLTNAVTGVNANFVAESLVKAGFDLKNLTPRKIDFQSDPHDDAKAWKHIWSAGQGVGAIAAVEPAAAIIARLKREYAAAVTEARRPSPWADGGGAAPDFQEA